MKKQTLTEGIVDKVYKLLSIGKYSQVQKNFKDSKEVQKAIKKSELARKDLIKAIDKYKKSSNMKGGSKYKDNFIKKYGG